MCDIPQQQMPELTTEDWKQVIKDVSSFGVQTIVFSGGEPLLRKDILELIACAKNNNLSACLTSNGVLVDEKASYELSRAGVDVVNISIEGTPDTHDYLRGNDTFAKAIYALKALSRENIECTIATMVSKYNYKDLPYIFELAKKHRVTTVRLQPFSKIFVTEPLKEKDFFIKEQDIDSLKQIIEEVIALSRRYHIATNPLSYLRKIPYYLSGKNKSPRGGCNALWTSCPVNSRGDIFPCWVLAQQDTVIGNLKEKRFFEIWDSKEHNHIRRCIVDNACSGCMMSCYDEVYGQDRGFEHWRRKVQRIKNASLYANIINKLVQRAKGEAFQLKSRYQFYRSYRGPIKKVFNRIVKNTKRNVLRENNNYKNDTENVLRELEDVKKLLQKERDCYL